MAGEGGFTIAPCREEDLADIAAIERESFTSPWSEEQFRREWSLPLSTILVTRGGEGAPAIGYIVYWLIVDEMHVHDIVVKKAMRRRGIASRILAAAIRQARSQGAVKATLEVRRSNEPAQRLYEKFGFAPSGVRKGYYTDTGDDALIMWARLNEAREELFMDAPAREGEDG